MCISTTSPVLCAISVHEGYHGYLMTAHWDDKKPSNFICVDSDPESVPGSFGSHDGALLYLVQANCGYFSSCPPLSPRARTHMRSLLKITIGTRVINLIAGSTKTTFPGKT